MPDLIYNVKFEIDSASAQQVGQIVDSSNSQDIKVLQKEVERLNSILKENMVENGKVKKSVKEKILAYKEEVASLKLLDTKINKSIQVYGKFSNETKELVFDLQRQATVVDNNGQQLLELANASDRTTGEVVALTNAVSTGNRAMVAGAKRAREMARAQQMMAQQVGQGNKTFAAGNQAIFSFSDLIQDSAQFSFGFAQGMRAIGNNIGFTAELLAVMSAQAKQAGQSLRGSLLQSLKGVNGVVLGINVAVTAFTMISQALTKQTRELSKELDKQKELLEELSSSFSETYGVDSLDVLQRVSDIIEGYGGLYKEQKQLQQDIAFLTNATSDGLSRGSQLVSDENELLVTKRNRLSEIEGFITSIESRNSVIASLSSQEKNDVLEILKARKEELEVRRNMRLLFLSALTEEEVAQQIVDAKNEVFTQMEKQYRETKATILEDPISEDLLQLDAPFAGLDAPFAGSIKEQEKRLSELRNTLSQVSVEAERQMLRELIAEEEMSLRIMRDGVTAVLDEIGDVPMPEIDLMGIDAEGFEFVKSLAAQQQEELTQITDEGAESRAAIFAKEAENFRISQEQKVQSLEIAKQATQAVSGILQGFFGKSKELAIAETLISTYFTAQKAYESQFLPVPTIDSPLRGKGAAALAVAQGLARVAAIKSTSLGGGGGGAGATGGAGGGGSAVSAISSTPVTSQSTQQISFLPNAASSGQAPPTVDVKIDRAGLAVAVNKGNRELANKQVRV